MDATARGHQNRPFDTLIYTYTQSVGVSQYVVVVVVVVLDIVRRCRRRRRRRRRGCRGCRGCRDRGRGRRRRLRRRRLFSNWIFLKLFDFLKLEIFKIVFCPHWIFSKLDFF